MDSRLDYLKYYQRISKNNEKSGCEVNLRKFPLKCGAKSYIVIPNFTNPRWIFPANKIIIQRSGNIVKVSHPKSKAGWSLFKLLNTVGLPQLIFSNQLIVSVEEQPYKNIIDSYLCKVFKREDLEFILYTGAYGFYQKFTIQIMDKRGSIIAYGKIGHTDQSIKRIKKEAKVLRVLNKTNFKFFTVPGILSLEKISHTEDIILLLTPHDRVFKSWNNKLTSLHIKALIELFLAKTVTNVEGKNIFQILFRSYKNIDHRNLSDELNSLCAETICLLEKYRYVISKNKYILGMSHGDFSPWNIYLAKNKLYIFDWELFKIRVPMWDIYNYIIHSEALINHKNYHEILQIIFSQDSRYYALIEEYVETLKRNICFDKKIFFIIFLFDLLLFYLKYCEKQIKTGYSIEKEVVTILNTAFRMLENV